MRSIAFSVRFSIRNYSEATRLSKLYLELRINGFERFFIPVAQVVAKDWCKKTQCLKSATAENKRINGKISEYRERAHNIVLKYEVNEAYLDKELFLSEFHGRIHAMDFLNWFEMRLNKRYGQIANVTWKGHKVTLNKLKRFSPTLYAQQINTRFLEKWQNHLLTVEKLHPNTVWVQHRNLRTYLNLAEKDGFIKDNPYKRFKLKKVQTSPVHLNKTELLLLDKLYFSGQLRENLQHTLQAFLFACYTGPRVSDLKKLSRENIMDNYLHYVPSKTIKQKSKEVVVSLGEFAHRYINKTGPLFSRIYPDARMNRFLKEIAMAAGINKRISTHVARHTFGFLLASADVPVTKIRDLMGHSNINTTMVYIHLASNYHRDSINRIDAFMNGTEPTVSPDDPNPGLRLFFGEKR